MVICIQMKRVHNWLPNSVFLGRLSIESQPQNAESRNIAENSQPCIVTS